MKDSLLRFLVVEAGLPASSEQLMELVMLSAIKTLGLSRVVWGGASSVSRRPSNGLP